MRILLVEDDQKLNKLIQSLLRKQSYVCEFATTVLEARQKMTSNDDFDMIILDLVLPDGDGVTYCKELRSQGVNTPILMLTSKSSTVDKVSGLDAGADDYMPKPFSPNELTARIRALLRRPTQTLSEVIVCGDVSLNVRSHSVKRAGTTIKLMPKEYSLLEYMIRKKNQVIKREDLLRHVWGVYSKTSSNRLEVYIRYLREKIDVPFGANSIQTIRGSGYKIADD